MKMYPKRNNYFLMRYNKQKKKNNEQKFFICTSLNKNYAFFGAKLKGFYFKMCLR